MSRRARGSVVVRARLAFAALAAASAVACSAAPGGSPTGSAGGPGTTSPGGSTGKGQGNGNGNGPASDAGVGEGAQVTETGKIIDLSSKQAVAGATVSAGDQTATTAKDGSYSLTVQKGKPFHLSVTADGYATLVEQETSLLADYDAGSKTIVPQATVTLLTGMLTGYDATLGVLSIAVVPTGGCASEDGSTVTVSPEGSARVTYFASGIPSPSLKAVRGGQFPSAVIYNVQPGVPLSVTVTHATCKQVAFPFTQDGVDYTGAISTEAGDVTGFARMFLQ